MAETEKGWRLLDEQAVTVAKSGDCVLLQCNNSDDARELFEWLSAIGNQSSFSPAHPAGTVFRIVDGFGSERYKIIVTDPSTERDALAKYAANNGVSLSSLLLAGWCAKVTSNIFGG